MLPHRDFLRSHGRAESAPLNAEPVDRSVTALATKTGKRRAVASAVATGQSAEGINPPSACRPCQVGSAPFPPPLRHCAPRERTRQPLAVRRRLARWQPDSLSPSRRFAVLRAALAAVAVFNITASYAKRERRAKSRPPCGFA